MIGGRPYTDRTTLIKGGYVLTLDPELGDLPLTDVLIDGDKIAAIGRNLTVRLRPIAAILSPSMSTSVSGKSPSSGSSVST